MTNEEAIKGLLNVKMQMSEETPFAEAVDLAVSALEKQIPKEIKREINDGRFERHCPNGCQVTEVTMYADIKYCPYCGQAIKK